LQRHSLAALYGGLEKTIEGFFGEDEVKKEAARTLRLRLISTKRSRRRGGSGGFAATHGPTPGPQRVVSPTGIAILAVLGECFDRMGSRCWHPQYRFSWVFSRTATQSSRNAVWSVASLRPRPPVAAIGALHSVLKRVGGDGRRPNRRSLAALGLARLSSADPEAMRVLGVPAKPTTRARTGTGVERAGRRDPTWRRTARGGGGAGGVE
jgi:hypothetical protein